MQTKTWTINEIQTAMRVAGSHWFDPDTMRHFRCRISERVYQGKGGIYFVSSERCQNSPRAYTVRQFTPSGNGVSPDVSTVGEFNSMTRRQAHTRAIYLAGESLQVENSAHRPVTDEEQFLCDIHTHGSKGAEMSLVWALMRQARKHHKLMEDYCNGIEIYDENEEPLPVLADCQKAIETLAREAGAIGVKFSGDPRGCTVKLIWHDRATDDFGKEGWCVPI